MLGLNKVRLFKNNLMLQHSCRGNRNWGTISDSLRFVWQVSEQYGYQKIKIQWVATKYFCANSEKTDLIGWLQTLTTSPPNHIRFLLVRVKKISKWKLGLKFCVHGLDKFETRLKFVLFCMFTQEPKNKMLDTETFLVSWFMWNHSLV